MRCNAMRWGKWFGWIRKEYHNFVLLYNYTELFNLLSLHKICSVAICIWVESPQESWHQSDMHRWKGSNFCSYCCTFPTSRNHKIPSRIIINILQWSMINGSFLHLAIYECSKSHALHIFHSNEWSWFFCSRAMTKSLTIKFVLDYVCDKRTWEFV